MFYLGVDALYASFCFCFDHYLSISFQVDIDLISTLRASFTLDIAEQDALIFEVTLSLYIVDFTLWTLHHSISNPVQGNHVNDFKHTR